jgi:Transposase DDE domain group 1
MSTVSSQLPTDFQPLLFNSLGSRQVVTDFSAGHLSSDGGMLLLRQLDEGLGLSRSLAGCFRDLRNPLLIEHSVRELVAQRLLGLAAGYEDLNDHNLLRLDPLFAVAVGKEDPLGTGRALPDQGKALASASTLNRLELGNNKNTRCHKISANHEEIAGTLLQMGVRSLPKHSQEVVIDLDAAGAQPYRRGNAVQSCHAGRAAQPYRHACDADTRTPPGRLSRKICLAEDSESLTGQD